MSAPYLSYRNKHHPAGEYCFTPDVLTLSIGMSVTRVEMGYDNERWRGISTPWSIKVMPAGQERTFKHTSLCRFGVIAIDEAALLSGDLRRVSRPFALLRDAPLEHLIRAVSAEAEYGPPTALFHDAVARAVVARLTALSAGSNGAAVNAWRIPTPTLARIVDYMHAHLSENIEVRTLADIAGLSVAHFSTVFRKTTGEPPHRYLIRLRVGQARVLIANGANPSQAAVACGFYDQSHLSRQMRRFLGATPARFKSR
jgi:AraC-like DNA-binding protein